MVKKVKSEKKNQKGKKNIRAKTPKKINNNKTSIKMPEKKEIYKEDIKNETINDMGFNQYLNKYPTNYSSLFN